MKQTIFQNYSTVLLDSTDTEYVDPLVGGGSADTRLGPTESVRQGVIGTAGTLRNFGVFTDIAPGAGTSYTFTIRKNGVSTAAVVTISDTDKIGQDTTHEVSFAAGDLISVMAVPVNSPGGAAVLNTTFEFEPDTSNLNFLSGKFTTNTSSKIYSLPTYSNNTSTTESTWRMVVPHACTIDSVYVKLPTAPGSGKSYAFSVYKNGSEEATSIFSISDTNTTGSVSSLSISLAQGDYLTFACDPTSTPATSVAKFSIMFSPDTDGESILLLYSNRTNVTQDWPLLGDSHGFQNAQYYVGIDAVLKDLHVLILTAPGSGNSNIYTVEEEGTPSSLAVTIANTDTEGSDTSDSITLTSSTWYMLGKTATGSPDTTARTIATYTQFIETSPTNSAKANIVVTNTNDNSSKANVAVINTKNNSVKANVEVIQTQDNSAKASIQIGSVQNNLVKADVLRTENQDNNVKADIIRTESSDNNAKASIVRTESSDNNAIGNILAILTQDNSTKANILVTDNTQDNSARASIVVTNSKDNEVIGNILATLTSDNNVKASIVGTNQNHNNVKANIFVADNTSDNSVKASIVRTESQDNSSKVSIVRTESVDNNSKANIVVTESKDNSSKANIKATQTQDNSSKANILVTGNTQDNSAKASIVTTVTKDNSSKANIKAIQTQDNSARGSIEGSSSQDNSVKANITATNTNDNSAKADIDRPDFSFDNSVKAKIQNTTKVYTPYGTQIYTPYSTQTYTPKGDRIYTPKGEQIYASKGEQIYTNRP